MLHCFSFVAFLNKFFNSFFLLFLVSIDSYITNFEVIHQYWNVIFKCRLYQWINGLAISKYKVIVIQVTIESRIEKKYWEMYFLWLFYCRSEFLPFWIAIEMFSKSFIWLVVKSTHNQYIAIISVMIFLNKFFCITEVITINYDDLNSGLSFSLICIILMIDLYKAETSCCNIIASSRLKISVCNIPLIIITALINATISQINEFDFFLNLKKKIKKNTITQYTSNQHPRESVSSVTGLSSTGLLECT